MNIAKNLKRIRNEKGITQKELAKFLGVSPSVIGQYEMGLYVPRDSRIRKIAKFLEVQPWEIDESLKDIYDSIQKWDSEMTEVIASKAKLIDDVTTFYGIKDPDIIEALSDFLNLSYDKQIKVAGYIDAIKD